LGLLRGHRSRERELRVLHSSMDCVYRNLDASRSFVLFGQEPSLLWTPARRRSAMQDAPVNCFAERQNCHQRLTFIMAALCNRGPLYFCPVVSFFYLLLSLWSPYVIGQTIMFSCCDLFFFFFSSPNLSGRRLDVYHILPHMMWP